MTDRNARTPALARHYRPAPPLVWFLVLVLLGALALGAAIYSIVIP